jgi:hypothetical protein
MVLNLYSNLVQAMWLTVVFLARSPITRTVIKAHGIDVVLAMDVIIEKKKKESNIKYPKRRKVNH